MKITNSYIKSPKKNYISFKSISQDVEKELDKTRLFFSESSTDKIKIDDSDTQWSHKYDEFLTNYEELSSDIEFHSCYNVLRAKNKNKQIHKLITQFSSHENNKKELEDLLLLGIENNDGEIIDKAQLVKNNLTKNDTNFKVLKYLYKLNKSYENKIKNISEQKNVSKAISKLEDKRYLLNNDLSPKFLCVIDDAHDICKWATKNQASLDELKNNKDYIQLLSDITYYKEHQAELKRIIDDYTKTSIKMPTYHKYLKKLKSSLKSTFSMQSKRLNNYYEKHIKNQNLDFSTIIKEEESQIKELIDLMTKKKLPLLPF